MSKERSDKLVMRFVRPWGKLSGDFTTKTGRCGRSSDDQRENTAMRAHRTSPLTLSINAGVEMINK